MNWANHLENNQIKKLKELQKINPKVLHVNNKPVPRKRNVIQTPFPHCTSKIQRKSFTPQKHSLVCSTTCFGVTKIITSNLLQQS